MRNYNDWPPWTNMNCLWDPVSTDNPATVLGENKASLFHIRKQLGKQPEAVRQYWHQQ